MLRRSNGLTAMQLIHCKDRQSAMECSASIMMSVQHAANRAHLRVAVEQAHAPQHSFPGHRIGQRLSMRAAQQGLSRRVLNSNKRSAQCGHAPIGRAWGCARAQLLDVLRKGLLHDVQRELLQQLPQGDKV